MRRDKVIPVPSALLEIVKEYEKKNGTKVEEYIFKNARGNAFNGQTFSNQMIEECEKRDINCGEYVFRAHDYRHSIATTMHEKGVAIQGIRDYLGHSSENMTKQYIDFMPEHITKAENKYFTKNQSFTLKGAEKNEK
jgi:integrase